MAKQNNHSKKRTNTRKKKQQSLLSIEVVSVVLILVLLLGMFQLGFLGVFFANLLRFFVGDLFVIAGGLGVLGCIAMLLRGRLQKLPWRFVAAAVCFSLAVLLFVEVLTFSKFVTTGGQLYQEAWARYSYDFTRNIVSQRLGSGMIGTVLYATTYFLVSQWGTYLIMLGLFAATLLLAFNVQLSDVLSFMREKSSAASERFEESKKQREAQKLQKQQEAEEVAEIVDVLPAQRQHSSLLERMKNVVFDEEEWGEQSAAVEDWSTIEVVTPEVETPVVPTPEASPIATTPVKTHEKITKRLTETEDDGEDLEDFEMSGEADDSDYQLPPVSLLNPIPPSDQSDERTMVAKNMKILERTFASFGVDAQVMPNPLLGPAVTKYEIKPAIGVKVSKIVNLSDDIALALAAKDIRIEAPIPGKPYVGIEVPNSKTSFVAFSDVIQAALQSPNPLDVPLGRDISGNVRLCDITKMPHMLIAGSTGSGKSVCINGIITSILMKAKPHEVKLMMIDPKMVELNVYNGIPHLLTPVVTNPRKAAQALQKVVAEMEKRYEMFAAMGMRNIDGYNAHVAQYNAETGEDNPLLPYIVVIVDELADLMMVASNEVEDAIIRLAQMARAAGIHMILATQRPSVDVITGIIKANVPSRIAFAVSSGTDSRTIIDSTGAEKLLGRGDMLFMPMGQNKATRVQGAYLTDEEVERIVEFVKTQQEVEYDEAMLPTEAPATGGDEPEDELFYEVLEMIKELETISTSYIQRRFKIGFNRAARLIEELEARGYVGPSEGSKPRKVNVQIFLENTDEQ